MHVFVMGHFLWAHHISQDINSIISVSISFFCKNTLRSYLSSYLIFEYSVALERLRETIIRTCPPEPWWSRVQASNLWVMEVTGVRFLLAGDHFFARKKSPKLYFDMMYSQLYLVSQSMNFFNPFSSRIIHCIVFHRNADISELTHYYSDQKMVK